MANIVENDLALFIVANGLGGHQAGEKASQFFCECMLSRAKIYSKQIAGNPADIFSAWIKDVISEMKVLFDDDHIADQAYTTCAVLYLDDQQTLVARRGVPEFIN